ncbi:MAG TPA: carbohydrate kinase family protein, partial [Patescibacteria group bacterium]|nr:carbohydrate kinase family protein [Patescibacteria group bacterium]
MPKSRLDVITIGDCTLDHYLKLDEGLLLKGSGSRSGRLVLAYSQKTPVSEFLFFPGGNALNTAVGFSRLGLKTAIHTYLGAGHDGEYLYDRILKEKVDPRFVVRSKDLETDKSVILVTHGDRTVLSFHSQKPYRLPSMRASWLYLTSLGAGYETLYQQVSAFIKKARVRLAYNPGSRQLYDSIASVRRMVATCDLLFVNLEEAQVITGKKAKDLKLQLASLHRLGAKKIIVTLGPRGASCFDGTKFWRVGAFPARRVDATGAGDSFAAGTCAALIR